MILGVRQFAINPFLVSLAPPPVLQHPQNGNVPKGRCLIPVERRLFKRTSKIPHDGVPDDKVDVLRLQVLFGTLYSSGNVHQPTQQLQEAYVEPVPFNVGPLRRRSTVRHAHDGGGHQTVVPHKRRQRCQQALHPPARVYPLQLPKIFRSSTLH